MIGVGFKGQLGNQMFQYATARVQAERLGCGLLVVGYLGRRKSRLAVATGRPPDEIFKVFPHLPISLAWRALGVVEFASYRGYMKAIALILPRKFENAEEAEVISYDPSIWNIASGTLLVGYFQSDKYFLGREADIRSWFRPSTLTKAAVQSCLATLPGDASDYVAVHVRLGDYLQQRGAFGDDDTGWALPKAYYERALSKFAPDRPIALFSDNPARAVDILPRSPTWISTAREPATDLFLMGAFKDMILANSTFSWWSAWLNTTPGKIVVGPEFFLGWRSGRWFPSDIMVEGWHYC